MATAKTGVIKVSGLTITDNGTKSVKINGTNGTKLAITTVDDTATVKLVSNKTADYILEDYKQLFTGDRKSVSLFGSAATAFDATEYDKYSPVRIINATAMGSAVSLKGNDSANQLIAGANGATLDGGAGNDSLTGGKGADLFVYTAGNDIIKSFTASSDTIRIDDAAVADASVSGKNIVLKIDNKNSLTVEGMSSKDLAFTDSDGDKTLKGGIFYEGTAKAIVSNVFNKTAKTTVDAKIIDASIVTKAVNLSGNSSANSILGGAKNDTLYGAAGKDTINGGKGNDKLYGEAGNDVLYGGDGADTLDGGAGKDKLYGDAGNDVLYGAAGNDTIDGGAGNDKLYGDTGNDVLYCGAGNDSLWGGAGKDEFIYASGDGNDVIFGFNNYDTLTLDDISFTSATVNSKGTEVALKLGSGSITFKEYASGTQFHINSDTYQITASGNKYSFSKAE